ncbi:39816_t:CDS:2 [Gigaspora margarita]|uniref:39816_t:CDS:1 n=1 Tax=Gigaspora margarita TaxID=4874 RepID=A0ABN7UXI4_GIGMA|nr:39816_t:CDS:2 [Gigaspora margarita]
MSAFENKTSHPEVYTSLLKVYQEANPTKKKRYCYLRSTEPVERVERLPVKAKLKHMKEQAQASSTTIAEDTIEAITEDITDDTTDDTSKRREMPAQTKLKEELIQLNWELSQL